MAVAELLADLSRATDANSSPLAGATWSFYDTGTTTPRAVYANVALSVSLGSSVAADGGGQFPAIFFDSLYLYRGILKTAAGVTVKDLDPINAGVINALSGADGAELVGFQYDGTGAQPTTLGSVIQSSTLNLREFAKLADEADFTSAYQAAIADGYRNFYLPAGTYIFNAGNNGAGAQIVSGVHIFGDGGRTIIRRDFYGQVGDGTSRGACFLADSGAADVFIDDISFENLKFIGDVDTHGHDETYGHLLFLCGVRNVRINNCIFEAACSDAVHIGTIGGPNVRHNFNVNITSCTFDGVLNGVVGGRNAISFIDIDGGYVAGNAFRNWSQDNMPGTIDCEPDNASGVIKNLRITGNDFQNCAGNRGHVTLATVHCPAENLSNVVISGNTFDSNTAVCIYTDETVPSSFPTVRQNIVITDNVGTNLDYFLNKVAGPIFGLTVKGNIADAPCSLGNSTANYTLKEVLFEGNNFASATTFGLAISNNIENLMVRNNTFSGATQSHIALGIPTIGPVTGTATSYVSIIGNRFIGAPTNGMVQHDAVSFNPDTNVWANNHGDAGVTHSFRAYRTDFPGILFNLHAIDAAPSTFPYGKSEVVMTSVSGPTGTDTGTIATIKPSSGDIKRTEQRFYPEYSAGELTKTYYRRAIDASTWSAWKTVTAT